MNLNIRECLTETGKCEDTSVWELAASRHEVLYGKEGLLNGRRAFLTERPLCLWRTLFSVCERRGFHSSLVDVYRLFQLHIDTFYWLFSNLNAAAASEILARYHTTYWHVPPRRNLLRVLGCLANLAWSYLSVLTVLMEHLGSHWTNLIFEYFSKICRENSSFIKVLQEYN
jgi:hypothetical protein